MCKIQLYEHKENNVGFEFNQICSSLPSLLINCLSLGTLFYFFESQSHQPNVYWGATLCHVPVGHFSYLFHRYERAYLHKYSASYLCPCFTSTGLVNNYWAVYSAGNKEMIACKASRLLVLIWLVFWGGSRGGSGLSYLAHSVSSVNIIFLHLCLTSLIVLHTVQLFRSIS